MILMSGAKLAAKLKTSLKKEVKKLKIVPKLVVILVGDDPASHRYVNLKMEVAKEIGIGFKLYKLSKNVGQKEIMELIQGLNKDKKVTGIIVQLPLPKKLNMQEILEKIDPKKDVDGLTSTNMGCLIVGLPGLYPATPEGITRLLENYRIKVAGKEIVIIGKSNIVGQPLAHMLLNRDATVTVAHIKTKYLSQITREADIIISAAGKPGLVTASKVKKGVVIVDVGATRVGGNRLKGDIDFKAVAAKASYITPVPGGVGPMTVIMLLSNVVKARKLS
jgi:methylenetetrahydrofolate dehydrogenase (NADP+) / methenyltetrahydrofolate cyclohydrolase